MQQQKSLESAVGLVLYGHLGRRFIQKLSPIGTQTDAVTEGEAEDGMARRQQLPTSPETCCVGEGRTRPVLAVVGPWGGHHVRSL